MPAAGTLLLVCLLFTPCARSLTITGPVELADLVFGNIEACLGKRLRPVTPYELPVTKSPQYDRAWGDYRSLSSISERERLCRTGVLRSGCDESTFTKGRLLLAAPYNLGTGPGTPVKAYSDGCGKIDTSSALYGDVSMKGQICLVSRGSCPFAQKWRNCAAAGANAVIIHNTRGSGKFMVGPGETYDQRGIPLLTMEWRFFEKVRDWSPNVTVVLETEVPVIVSTRNCTAEAHSPVRRSPVLLTDPSDKEIEYTLQKCKAEVKAKAAADATKATLTGLYSGEMLGSAVMGPTSDDPYSSCVLEEACSETWTEIPMYTATVITITTLLVLCLIQVTSMFCFGSSRSAMKPREPRLKFHIIRGISPHLGCCRCCFCPTFPLFYKKPQEFLQTGFFRYFLYTWAFFPRKADPQMTFASRLLCTVVCTLVGLMVLMILGNSGVKYQGMRSGSDIELAGEAYENMVAGDAMEMSPTARIFLNMAICVTVQEISKQVIRRWMGKLHEMASEGEGLKERSKWALVPSLITTVVLDAYVLISMYFLYVLMTNSSCTVMRNSVLVPFVGTVPFVALLAVVGPYGYIAHNTFGTGQRIDQVLRDREGMEVLWTKHDADGNGTLSRTELRALLDTVQQNVKESKFDSFFDSLDTDSSGSLEKEEFVEWWCAMSPKERDKALTEMEQAEAEEEEQANIIDEASMEKEGKKKASANKKGKKKTKDVTEASSPKEKYANPTFEDSDEEGFE